MKLLTKVALVSGLSLFASSAMAGSKFIAGDNRVETKICIVAGEGTKHRFIKTVKDSRIRMSVIANKLECNGQRVASFAKHYGNMPVYNTLSRYVKPHVEIYRTTAATR